MTELDEWRYKDLRERIDAVDRAWRERLGEIITGSVKRLDQMDAELEDFKRETNSTLSKMNESISAMVVEIKSVQTHIQNRLLWSVTGASVAASLLSGFAGHIFFR